MHASDRGGRRMKSCFLAFTALSAIAGATLGATAAQAQSGSAQATYEFDLPAQPLSQSVLQVGSIGKVQVLYSDDGSPKVNAPALKGRMTVDQALARLLAGSGYTYEYTRPGVVTLRRAVPVGNGDGEVAGVVQVEGLQGSPYFGGAGQMAGVNGVNGSRDITATEGTGSFTSGALTIGSKVPQALKDVPQSISVLTQERLEQQNVTDFTTAMKQLPGVTLVQGSTSLETTFYSRGFTITNIQVDGGAPLTTRMLGNQPGYFPQIDMSVYDHIELLRGAAGQFGTYGEPSGTVNLVRKKPLDHAQFSVEAQAGSWQNYRVVADATSPLAFDGRLRGRLVLTYQDNHHFYDIAKDNKTLIYGVAEYDVTPTTLLTAGISYTRQDSVPWKNGLPRYLNGADIELPRSTCLCFAWNRWDFDTTELFGGLEQKLGEEWNLKLNLTRNHQASTQKSAYSRGAVNPTNHRGPTLRGSYSDYESTQLSAEAVLRGAFEVFGQRQEITLGLNRSRSDAGGNTSYFEMISTDPDFPYQPYPGGPSYYSGSPNGSRVPIDVFNFDPANPLFTEPRSPLASSTYPVSAQTQFGAYLNLRLTAFDRLHLGTGIRWSRYEGHQVYNLLCGMLSCDGGKTYDDPISTTTLDYGRSDISWPPAVNLSYDLTKSVTAYVSYTDIYEDQSRYLDSHFTPIEPITGSNWEAGIKWAADGGRLNLAVSAYRIHRKGTNIQDGAVDYNTGEFVATDGTRVPNYGNLGDGTSCCWFNDREYSFISQGFDFDVTGEVSPGWQISANYTFSDLKTDSLKYFGDLNKETFLSIAPKHLFKIWTSYDFGAAGHQGWLSGLALSLGVNGQSSGFNKGFLCVNLNENVPPNPITGSQPCLSSAPPDFVEYSFVVPSHAVFSGRIDYRFSDRWALAINLENILDKTYYQTVGIDPTNGHWYGAPRSFTATLKAKW